MYLDFKQDESYTPQKLSIRIGTSYHDLHEVKVVEMDKPVGWTTVSLESSRARFDTRRVLFLICFLLSSSCKAFLVQVCVVSNHQNGRDTHIRQIKIFGPLQYERERKREKEGEYV